METQRYWLSGCGVTLEVTQGTMAGWVDYILEMGGVPTVELTREEI